MVRERQIIIRLPNANDMQVKATVNEARVTLVRPGLPVTIRVDALKDELIEGVVTKVNQYAEAGGYSSGNIKKYATFVKIVNPPPGLRVGMNAEVRIHVERMSDALQVPVQGLAELKGHYFSLVQNGEDYSTREVKIGTTNDKVATIVDGLKEGDKVVMNPRASGGLLKLPDLPDPTPTQVTEVKRNDPSENPLRFAATGKGPGGEGGEEGKKGKKGGGGGGPMSPTMLVDRVKQYDEDSDGKLSEAEMAKIDMTRVRWLEGADKNNDKIIDRIEMLGAADAFVKRMQEGGGGRGGGGGGFPGGGGGGRRGGGNGEGGPPSGGPGPAGGAE